MSTAGAHMGGACAWQLERDDVADLAAGCGWLGSGGGGDTYALALTLRNLIDERGPIPVLDPRRLAPDAIVFNVAFIGAPITMHEKLFTEVEIVAAVRTMQQRLGGRASALMATEIGGGNGLVPFIAGALFNLPVVDADGMGRAFPLADHASYAIYGRSSLPSIAAGENGEIVVVEAGTNHQVERLVRAISVALGSKCFGADHPLTGSDVRECAVLDTVSMARQIGASIRHARHDHADPLAALAQWFETKRGIAMRVLFDGKVAGVEHDVREGWGFGTVRLQSSSGDGPEMTVDFQNEFLVAHLAGRSLVTTPDIITLIDASTLLAISSDGIRYGQRVKVIGIESPSVMSSERALAVVGPRAFGYETDYRSLSALPAVPGGSPGRSSAEGNA